MPTQFLPGWVTTAGDLTPLASFRAALEDVWVGGAPRVQHLVVLAGTALLAWLDAVRLFRTA